MSVWEFATAQRHLYVNLAQGCRVFECSWIKCHVPVKQLGMRS